jgi:MFS family permease
MLLAVVPLVFMPGVEYLPSAVPRTPWRSVLRAMSQQPYRQLVLFSCVFSFVNGITQAAQGTFPPRVLKISYQGIQTITATMRAGQMALAPTMGRWCDAFGSRPVMIVSQLVVATGPLFLFMATRENWWWLVGAYVAWIAYAGLNVGLDNIKLKLAPADNNVPYLTAYYTAGDVIFGSSILLAGWIFDRLEDRGFEILQVYAATFLVGWLGRTLVAALLVPIVEPDAWRVRDLAVHGARKLIGRATPGGWGRGSAEPPAR